MPTVLVVEDHPDLGRAMSRLLQASGYEAVWADDGPTALETIRRSPPDLILLDVMMPGMSGMDVLRQVRADPVLAALPAIVMFTAMDDAATRREAADLGAREYVVKGRIDAATLAALVRRHLGPAATAGRG